MGNVIGKCYLKKEGENYAEGLVLDREGLGTFNKIHLQICDYKGTGLTEETFTCNGISVKRVRWKVYNVTKDVSQDFPECSNEMFITEDWRGDLLRAMPKLGGSLQHISFHVQTWYT